MIYSMAKDPNQVNISLSPAIRELWEELNEGLGVREKYKTFTAALLKFTELPASERDECIRAVSHAMRKDEPLVRMAKARQFSALARKSTEILKGPVKLDRDEKSSLFIHPADEANPPASRSNRLGNSRSGGKGATDKASGAKS